MLDNYHKFHAVAVNDLVDRCPNATTGGYQMI